MLNVEDMRFYDSLIEGLKKSVASNYEGKVSRLAKAADVHTSTVSRLLDGERKQWLHLISRLADKAGLDVISASEKNLPGTTFVGLVKATLRAGDGGLEVDEAIKSRYAFHESFLSRKGGNAADMKLFIIDGDSMEPTLKSGDMVMVNERKKEVSSGGIYLLRHRGDLMIKRLFKTSDGGISIHSDNKELYPPISVDFPNEALDFEVFGRMIWSCREY